MYSEIVSHRMPYDIDGTAVAYEKGYSCCLTNWLTEDQLVGLNTTEGTNDILSLGDTTYITTWFFFPEMREIEAMMVSGAASDATFQLYRLEGSNDTTNGQDGTWEVASFPSGVPAVNNPDANSWRTAIKAVSFSEPKKTVRVVVQTNSYYFRPPRIKRIHFYGRKAARQTVDDVTFCDINGNELTALTDWADRPEGTTLIKSLKVLNSSPNKIANNVNLQLNHKDFALSFSETGPWTTVLDIASIGPGSLSSAIYVRNALEPPLLILGPDAGRLIATVGSWT